MKSIFDNNFTKKEQNIWPSFTDVMMVVIMIFILAMVVTISHNTQLFKQLLSTKTEVLEKQKFLEQLEKIKRELNAKINELESKLSTTQLKVLMLTEENQKLKSNLEGKVILIGKLTNEIKALNLKQEELQNLLQQKEKTISEKENIILDLRTQQEKLKDQLQELEILKNALQQKYSELQEKYLKLVGPARSPLGKVIFRVKYFKRNGKPVYLMAPVGEKKLRSVSYNELIKALQKAKDKYKKKLYVQIIIPSNSNLTYDEAYKFTNYILRNFDYYYQK